VPECLDVQVQGFLVGLGVELEPPASRWDIASLWLFQMLIGAPIARFATVITSARCQRPAPEAGTGRMRLRCVRVMRA
jgi:hypothetical protein